MDALRNARMSTATYAGVVLPYCPVARAAVAHNIRLRFAVVRVSCGVWCGRVVIGYVCVLYELDLVIAGAGSVGDSIR
jgi:hypothetical protein